VAEERIRTQNGKPLAVFPVQKVAHGCAAGFVRFFVGVTLDRIRGALLRGFSHLLGAASGALVSKARFTRFQLKFLRTDNASFDRERHLEMVGTWGLEPQTSTVSR
jgi:hypothetical protein